MSQHFLLPSWENKDIEQKIQYLRQLIDDLYTYVLSDPRQRLISILDTHIPSDSEEAKAIDGMRSMILQFPNILSKNCEPGHVVGSGLVINVNTGRVLLHRHKTLNMLLQFGGHTEFETAISDVAMREASEESGLTDLSFYPDALLPKPLDIDFHIIPSSKGRPNHYHLDFRYLLSTQQEHPKVNRETESDNFLWMSEEDLPTYEGQIKHPEVRLIKKAFTLFRSEKLGGNSRP